MDAREFVLLAGTEIRATGRLVRTGEGDWFDPPLPTRAIAYGPGGAPAPRPSRFAVPVEGADFDRLAFRYERDGSVEGYATVTGVWLEDRIRIDQQTDDHAERQRPDRTDPPCPPPPGGWPLGVAGRDHDDLDFDLGDLEDTGAAVAVVILRPSGAQAVLVVAATDIATVEARLRPQLGDRLCVVPSRWTREQLDDAGRYLDSVAERWQIYAYGPTCDERAQATMTVTLVRVTEEIEQWIAGQPDGLVAVEPWLTPLSMIEP